jgi:alpha,alpha-trehalose phosphorylase (configuration-retaining)
MDRLETSYPDLIPDCSIMRLEPNDQLLNTIISNAHVVLQLSTREGFEVKVSEALRKGRPVIATRAGGIPLQVQDGVNGYIVEPNDWRAAAAHLRVLFTDSNVYDRMSTAACSSVSDELSTVGNALSWYYLAAKWAEMGVGPGCLRGDERWVNDMAREEAGRHYAIGENRLARDGTQKTVDVDEEDRIN